MNKFIVCLMLIFAAVFFTNVVKAESSAVGTWKNIADEGADKGKAKSHLELFEKGGIYYVRVAKLLLKPQDELCTKCVGNLKNKPVVGMIIMSGMKKTGNVDKEFGEEYAGGKIMDPDNGKYYTCKFWVKGDVLVMRGYIAFFYRTQRWYRVK